MGMASIRSGVSVIADAWRRDRASANDSRPRRADLAFLPGLLAVTEAPPSRLVMALPMAMLGLVVVAIGYSLVGTVQIVSIAEGRLVPAGRVKQVQPADAAVVRRILVHEGQAVKAGDPVIELDAGETGADRRRAADQLAEAELTAARLRALLSDEADPLTVFQPPAGTTEAQADLQRRTLVAESLQQRSRLAAADGEVAKASAARDQIAAQVRKLEQVVPLIQKRADARNALAEKQIVSLTAQLELQQTLIETTSELAVQRQATRHAEAEIALAREHRRQGETDFRRERLAELATKEREILTYTQDLAKADTRDRRQTLTAPIDGVVQDLTANSINGVVRQADVLMRIVPGGQRLEVEARVQNKDIGFVEAGQHVSVKLETFPFLLYGTIAGEVVDVSRDVAGDDPKGPAYKARIALARDYMPVGERQVPLSPGMAATVDIETGRRRIFDYVLAPVLKRTGEAMRER